LTPGTPVDEDGAQTHKLTVNPDGTIRVSPETPAGVYEFPYTICEVLNPENCSSTTVTVVVEEPEIQANENDFGPINGKDGGNTPSVLDNDTLNEKPVDPKEIRLTPGTPVDEDGTPTDKLTMNPDGTIKVSPETPAGVYEFPYTICEDRKSTRLNSS